MATLGDMFPGRVWIALGSGEALNESITGDAWPSKNVRHRRLRECVEIMRALWAGETVTHDGLVRVKGARLYSRPAQTPLLLGAAITPETARWTAGWADGLITTAGERARMRRVVEAFREGGGHDKPLCLQVALSYAASDEACVRIAHDQWRQAALPPALLADLATPLDFDRATLAVDPRDVLAVVRASADVNRHLAWLAEDVEMGFTQIYLHNVNPDHHRFFGELAPRALALGKDQGTSP
jgi:G6PDH family F420-dependent oxidoreductase